MVIKKELFYINPLYSHPEKTLEEHLKESKNSIFLSFNSYHFNFDDNILSILADSLFIVSISHDFGKSTQEFQKKLFSKKYSKKLSNHSLISALFGYFLFKKYLELHNKEYNKNTINTFSFFIYKSIKRHHGNINNKENCISYKDRGDMKDSFENVKNQLENIKLNNRKEINKIYNDFLNTDMNYISKFELFLSELEEDKLINDEICIPDPLRRNKNFDFFFIFNLIYSLLLEADKKSAANIDFNYNKYKEKNITLKFIENYKKAENFNNTKIFNQFREEFYQSAIRKLEKELKEKNKKKIFILNAPTGSGKTLTMFGLALLLKNRSKRRKELYPHIIYSLPFISIIDQNYKVIYDILEKSIGRKISTDLILPFHHLSDRFYESPYEEALSFDESTFLIDNWHSKIIVTSFFQIFKSIFTNKNHLLQRFNKLINSIIIIDEIQAIPSYLHNIISRTLEILCIKFDCLIIIGTATFPKIFDFQKEIELIELYDEEYLSNEYKLFQKNGLFHRYDVNIHLLREKKVVVSQLIDFIINDIKSNYHTHNNFGVILNTIESSKKIFNLLKEKFKNFISIYLSTNIPPVERLKRINRIKDFPPETKFFVVSTQIIEAGVDISLEKIYRDIAPLDSIVQTCGRVNRNAESSKGVVFLFELIDEENKSQSFSSYIYDKLLLSETKYLLNKIDSEIIPEYILSEICMKYFERLDNISQKDYVKDKSKNPIHLPPLIEKNKHKDIERYFKLIEEYNEEITIFIIDEREYNKKKNFPNNPREL